MTPDYAQIAEKLASNIKAEIGRVGGVQRSDLWVPLITQAFDELREQAHRAGRAAGMAEARLFFYTNPP